MGAHVNILARTSIYLWARPDIIMIDVRANYIYIYTRVYIYTRAPINAINAINAPMNAINATKSIWAHMTYARMCRFLQSAYSHCRTMLQITWK